MGLRVERLGLVGNALLIAALGGVIGVAANALSPRGLSLTRDYFPPVAAAAAGASERSPAPTPALVSTSAATATPSHTKRGLPLATLTEVLGLYRDPRYAEQRILFIDARDGDHYAAGHIPGALEFDHYHPERGAATVLGPAQIAERIVVYCNGGDCEDSELATLDLISLGVPAEKLVVYGGGIGEWRDQGLPMRTGATP